ncbi:hypothetical protein [Dactylosporangium matsuzakiense]|uniref:hypothetical protein n=1 Tax=Dactylosporangium matsuzakiense TaxID=53360 RepID=UPI0021C4BF77|nr:hypothetical protein [Dactylosporangium matsuzakiense]
MTNVDDLVVLALFFAQGAGQRGVTRRIAAGQYLGFAAIVAVAAAAAGPAAMSLYVAVFLALVAVWVAAGRYLATRPPVARALEHRGHPRAGGRPRRRRRAHPAGLSRTGAQSPGTQPFPAPFRPCR